MNKTKYYTGRNELFGGCFYSAHARSAGYRLCPICSAFATFSARISTVLKFLYIIIMTCFDCLFSVPLYTWTVYVVPLNALSVWGIVILMVKFLVLRSLHLGTVKLTSCTFTQKQSDERTCLCTTFSNQKQTTTLTFHVCLLYFLV